MILQQYLQIGLGILLVVVAVLAIESKKVINSVIYLSLLSLLAVVGFALMNAPDVAITEAVIGSGLVTALFVFTLLGVNDSTATKDKKMEDLDIHQKTEQMSSLKGGENKWKK